MPSKGGTAKNPKINLRIIGATNRCPGGLFGEGKDCDGLGRYYYVANGHTGAGALAHTVGTQILLWKSRRVGRGSKKHDAPYAPADAVSEKQAEAALKAVNKGINKRKSASVSGFKGTWKGYIECHTKGPQIVLYRDVPSYGRIVCVSEFAKGKKSARWDVAVVLRDRKWYTRGQKEVQAVHTGIASLNEACRVGFSGLLDLVCKVTGVRELIKSPAQRAASRKRAAEKTPEQKKRAKTSVSNARKKAVDVKVSVSQSIKALVGKKIRITNANAGPQVKEGQFAIVAAAIKAKDGKVTLKVQTIKAGGGLVKTLKSIAAHRVQGGKNKRTFTSGKTVNTQFAAAKKRGLSTQADLKAALKALPKPARKGRTKAKGGTRRATKMRAADKKFRDAKFVSLTFGGSKQTGKVIAKLDLPAGQDDWNKAVMTIQLPNGETTSGTLKKYRGDAHGMRVKGGASPSAAFVKEQKKVAKAAKGSKASPSKRSRRAKPAAAVAPPKSSKPMDARAMLKALQAKRGTA